MRGKRVIEDGLDTTTRITPADAGKTVYRCLPAERYTDHPRGCGENEIAEGMRKGIVGSPPRMRGKHIYVGYKFTVTRITPADAGKTGCELK